ncbi:hypothetical protein NFI96_022247, partial [Prochilodus magdalenae]
SHSLQYFYTAVTPGIDFPEFTVVGLVDGEQHMYYDSNIKRLVPRTDWMEQITADDPDYWNRESEKAQGSQETFKASIDILLERFNQTQGVHTVQVMYGCELDDDGIRRGYRQEGYDGEDFLSLDMNTLTWTAANPKAVITKLKLDGLNAGGYHKFYLENTCIEWLQKYVDYGRSTLERKVPPEISLFQKDSSSPVVCHATGFFPEAVKISWKKNGEDLYEGFELRETQSGEGDSTFLIPLSLQVGEIFKLVATSHSLQYFYTAVTPGIHFAEYTVVGLVDGEQFVYYDSNIRKVVPKTEWMERNEGEEYWDRETEKAQTAEENFKMSVGTIMKRFNHTEGVHTVQRMYGCELHDDGTKRGYRQEGYDGEDFISLDLNTLTWTAANTKAVITKQKWEKTGAAHVKDYLENECIEWLEKYVGFGRSTLERKVVGVAQRLTPLPTREPPPPHVGDWG